jgi:hypothetical protein
MPPAIEGPRPLPPASQIFRDLRTAIRAEAASSSLRTRKRSRPRSDYGGGLTELDRVASIDDGDGTTTRRALRISRRAGFFELGRTETSAGGTAPSNLFLTGSGPAPEFPKRDEQRTRFGFHPSIASWARIASRKALSYWRTSPATAAIEQGVADRFSIFSRQGFNAELWPSPELRRRAVSARYAFGTTAHLRTTSWSKREDELAVADRRPRVSAGAAVGIFSAANVARHAR